MSNVGDAIERDRIRFSLMSVLIRVCSNGLHLERVPHIVQVGDFVSESYRNISK